ncbi:MAG: hypothetical protein J5J00_05720 [Deltaproteobacteria bacterium]|nr:hypothetical protein [Deltaproteobacteria bacterium]
MAPTPASNPSHHPKPPHSDVTVHLGQDELLVKWKSRGGFEVEVSITEGDLSKRKETIERLAASNPKTPSGSAIPHQQELFKELAKEGEFVRLNGTFSHGVVTPLRVRSGASVDLQADNSVLHIIGQDAASVRVKGTSSDILLQLPCANGKQKVALELDSASSVAGQLSGSVMDESTSIRGYALNLKLKGVSWEKPESARDRLKGMVFAWSNVERTDFEPFSKQLKSSELRSIQHELNIRMNSGKLQQVAAQLPNGWLIQSTDKAISSSFAASTASNFLQIVAAPDGPQKVTYELPADSAETGVAIVADSSLPDGPTQTIEIAFFCNYDLLFSMLQINAAIAFGAQHKKHREEIEQAVSALAAALQATQEEADRLNGASAKLKGLLNNEKDKQNDVSDAEKAHQAAAEQARSAAERLASARHDRQKFDVPIESEAVFTELLDKLQDSEQQSQHFKDMIDIARRQREEEKNAAERLATQAAEEQDRVKQEADKHERALNEARLALQEAASRRKECEDLVSQAEAKTKELESLKAGIAALTTLKDTLAQKANQPLDILAPINETASVLNELNLDPLSDDAARVI